MEQQALVGQDFLITGFTITFRQATLRRTFLEERIARSMDLYLTTQNTHNRQTSMPPAKIEPANSANLQLQTHKLDCVTTGTDIN